MTSSAPRGRRRSSGRNLWASVARRGLLAFRRGRWTGRGWPWSVQIERQCSFTGSGVISLSPGVRVNVGCWIHAEGDGEVLVGAGSAIGRGSVISALTRIDIGGDVLFGPHVLVMDHGHGSAGGGPLIHQDLIARGKITIESGVWIGAYACILSGHEDLVVGAESVIGAGAVVTESVPAGSVMVGPKAALVGRKRE